MTMKNGIKAWVNAALDTKDEIAFDLIEGGMDPKQAIIASTIITKNAVADKLDKKIGNRNAAEITTGLSNHTHSSAMN